MEGNRHYFDDSELCVEDTRFSSSVIHDESQLTIYPIPAVNELYVNTKKDYVQTIEIFNQLGQLIIWTDCKSNSGQITISLTDYPPGIYQIKVKVNSGKLYNEKFVIIK